MPALLRKWAAEVMAWSLNAPPPTPTPSLCAHGVPAVRHQGLCWLCTWARRRCTSASGMRDNKDCTARHYMCMRMSKTVVTCATERWTGIPRCHALGSHTPQRQEFSLIFRPFFFFWYFPSRPAPTAYLHTQPKHYSCSMFPGLAAPRCGAG